MKIYAHDSRGCPTQIFRIRWILQREYADHSTSRLIVDWILKQNNIKAEHKKLFIPVYIVGINFIFKHKNKGKHSIILAFNIAQCKPSLLYVSYYLDNQNRKILHEPKLAAKRSEYAGFQLRAVLSSLLDCSKENFHKGRSVPSFSLNSSAPSS